MSDGPRMSTAKAMAIADATMRKLSEHCIDIDLAGSLRRAWRGDTTITDVGDIDIVLSPKLRDGGLFGGIKESLVDLCLDEAVNAGTLVPIKRGEAMRSFTMAKHGIRLEVKSTPRETFGVALAIHTGPAEFSKALVTKKPAGILPEHIRVGGDPSMAWVVFADTERMLFNCEMKFFEAIGLPWIPAHQRSWPLHPIYAEQRKDTK